MELHGKLNIESFVGKMAVGIKESGGSKASFLLVNQGYGMYVVDLESLDCTIITNAEMNTAHISDDFHLDFNTIARNCQTVVADNPINVHWLRNRSYSYTNFELSTNENHFLWGASEFGGFALIEIK